MTKMAQTGDTDATWAHFAQEEALTDEQLQLFKKYYALLAAWNENINLTTIIDVPDVIDYHFKDSLRASRGVDLATVSHLADIGTGAGFPGIPLALKYLHLRVTLLEVTIKKITFLDQLITELGLGDRVTIFEEDWRTFLRATVDSIDLFCARASLQPDELIRMFKPSSAYRDKKLLYWASQDWTPSKEVQPYIVKEQSYQIRTKKRRLIVLENHTASSRRA
jgi:16S rRNA (guanine(527)-N(7))-methyltransferase RsmG